MLKLSKEEKEALVKEIAERCKDLVYIKAESNAKKVLEQIKSYLNNPDEEIEITYTITFLKNDLLQIIGRMRRKS